MPLMPGKFSRTPDGFDVGAPFVARHRGRALDEAGGAEQRVAVRRQPVLQRLFALDGQRFELRVAAQVVVFGR